MADPEIVTSTSLTSYLALSGTPVPAPEVLDLLVNLTNAVVLEKWTAVALPVPGRVLAIALEVAARAARNPKGLSSFTISLDDGSRTERLSDTAVRAGVYLTDDEVKRLKDSRKRRRALYGTIHVRRGV